MYKKVKPCNETEKSMLEQLQIFYNNSKDSGDREEINTMILFANCVLHPRRIAIVSGGIVEIMEEVL